MAPMILQGLQGLIWPSVSTFLSFSFAAILIYATSKGVYNRYFHPLSRFPGPFLGSITDWYLVCTIASLPTHGLALHKEHGPIIRLAPNLLCFSDPELLPVVYHRHADKPAFYGSWMFGKTAAMFQTLEHKGHAAKKRLIANCCSMNTMRLCHETRMSERIDELCRKLVERSSYNGKAVNFSDHLRWFLSDTWNHLVYGRSMECVAKGEDVQGLLGALQGVYGMSAMAAVMPWLMPMLRNPWMRRNIWVHTRTFRNMEILFSHHEKMTSQKDSDWGLEEMPLFFDSLKQIRNPTEFRFSEEDIKAEVVTFTAATLDGVAAFISPFVNNVISQPEVRMRVVAEIRAADEAGLLSKPVVSYDETLKLPFFMACIKETLRCDAPAQTILPRLVSDGGYRLRDGTYIPGGVQIGASPFIIHRDPSVFGSEPDLFQPSRWLPGEDHEWATDANIKRMERLGMWWGYGDRECAGKNYAQMEMQKLCVELLRRFEIRKAAGTAYTHARWAVGMFWNQQFHFDMRESEVRLA